MRWLERSGVVWVQAALGLAVAGLPSVAAANGIDCAGYANCLSVELGPQRTGEFATLTLQDVAEGVQFTIALDEAVLGPHANLHEFYFNLPDGFRIDEDDVRLTSCDVSSCSIDFDQGRSVRGGAGADFDFSVAFDAGNRRIQMASFVVSALGLGADGVLAAALENPGVTGRDLAVLFAAHVQGSGNGRGSASATVGVPVPEPDTVALFGLGLAGLAFAGRRRS
jgi:hypothetical protein